MNYSYKRYYEPSLPTALISSVSVGAIATMISYPLDLVKTRVQQRAEGIGIRQKSIHGGYNMNKIFRETHEQGHGTKGLFAGLGAGLIARCGHLFIRNFLYKIIYDRVKPVKPTNDLSWREKAWIGGFAGAVAAFIMNPAEVIMVRQMCDTAYRPELRRNYKTFTEGYNKILASEGGNLALMKGVWPSVIKAIILNASLTGPFDYLNERLYISIGDYDFNKWVALVYASVWATALTLPIDNIKTRMQLAHPDPARNRMNYNGVIDCITKIFVNEGPHSFFVGFYPFYIRTLLYSGVTVYLMDKVTMAGKKAAGLKEEHM